MTNDSMTEQRFAEIIAENGGRVYRVGGCVRDAIMGVAPKDIDLCVVGMVKKDFKNLFASAEEYGKSFPVFRIPINGVKCEVAFARTERKVGSGYKGFKVASNPKVTIEQDLYRRDLTVNAIAVDSITGEMIDPFNGMADIKAKILRAIGPHFSDDPIRALRLAGQAARLDFQIEPATITIASAVAQELVEEPVERVLAELTKVLAEAAAPARFFTVLAEARLLETVFKEIAALSAQDFAIAMKNLDCVARDTHETKVRFASLGLVLAEKELLRWNTRMTLPREWLDAAVAVGKVKAILQPLCPENVVTAIYHLSRGSLDVEGFDIIAKAVDLQLPHLADLKTVMHGAVADRSEQPLKGKEIGAWLRNKHIQAVSLDLEKKNRG